MSASEVGRVGRMNPDEIRQRAEKATPGPWGTYKSQNGWHYTLPTGERGLTGPIMRPIMSVLDQEKADVDFIAHAREDIPALLDVLAVRDQELAIAQQRGDGWRDTVREDVEILRGLRDELRERAERLAVRDQQLKDARELLSECDALLMCAMDVHRDPDFHSEHQRELVKDDADEIEALRKRLQAFAAGLDVQEAGQ